MNQRILILALLLVGYVPVLGQSPDETIQIIVKLKKDVAHPKRTWRNLKHVGNASVDSVTFHFKAVKISKQSLGRKNNHGIYVIRFPAGTNIQQVIDDYYKTGEIEYAEADQSGKGGGAGSVVPNDPFYFRQWGLKNDGSFSLFPAVAGADIDMERAWELEQGDTNIVVAIMDSGAKLDHPEFAGRIWRNKAELANNSMDDDGNGYVDDALGWDFVNNDNNPTDDHGHGTNVAGIVGATGNNSIGYAGVDWYCKLMILKGLTNMNTGLYSWWSEAIYYAVDNGARVINLSVGGSGVSVTLQTAIDYALANYVVVVACMMNTNTGTPYYPAAYPGVIAVGATSANDSRANPFSWSPTSGSNFGAHISVIAPGNQTYGLSAFSDTNFDSFWGGTSQAAPLVSGLASLLVAQDPGRKPSEIKFIIVSTAEDQVGNSAEDTPGFDPYYGHGRVNAYEALTLVTGIDSDQDARVAVFPNPTTQDFTIRFPLGTTRLRIFDSFGKSILTNHVEGLTTQDAQLAEGGMYLIQVTMPKQSITRKLLVSK